jgi:hypothetical protein
LSSSRAPMIAKFSGRNAIVTLRDAASPSSSSVISRFARTSPPLHI